MSILVDSSIWIDYFNGVKSHQTDYLDQILGEKEIIVGDLILSEVLQGFRDQKDFDLAKDALQKFQIMPIVGQKIAIKSAQNYRNLRKRGLTIRKIIDCLIATFCIENAMPLLHNDRDFDHFEDHLGLQIIHPELN